METNTQQHHEQQEQTTKAATTRPFPDTDFLESVLFYYSTPQLHEAYDQLVGMITQLWPNMAPRTIKLMQQLRTNRVAMQMMMIFVLLMDESNGFLMFARTHAMPLWRLEYFREVMRPILARFLHPPRDREPDVSQLMPIVWKEYQAYRDNGDTYRSYYEDQLKRPPPAAGGGDGTEQPPRKKARLEKQ